MFRSLSSYCRTLVSPIAFASEMKQVEQIPDGRTVDRHIRVVFKRDRIRKIVPAAAREWPQVPISLDELQNRDVIGIGGVVMPASRKLRDDNQRNARAVAEEVERLDVARIVKPAAFILRD